MNSPQKTRTVPGIVKSVRLFLNSKKGEDGRICVLVEGSDDAKIYARFFKNVKTKVMVIKSTGKQKMLESLQILANITRQAIGICDADFFHLDKNHPAIPHLFFTDCHDIEMTMLKFTDVFHDSWSKFSSQDNTREIMYNVLQSAAYIAYIRWYSQRNQYNLAFAGLKFTDTFQVWEGKIRQDNGKLLDTLNQRSDKKIKLLTSEEIDIFIQENQTDDTFNLCNGHDVTALIVLILEDKTKNIVSRKNYCDVLQESFQFDHFAQTRLYGNLLLWQSANGFDILKTDLGAANA